MNKVHELNLPVVIDAGTLDIPSEEQVKIACYDFLLYLRELTLMSFGEDSPLLSVATDRNLTDESDFKWNGTDEQLHFVETSGLWHKFSRFYEYGQLGKGDISDLIEEGTLLETIYQLNTVISYIDEIALQGSHDCQYLINIVCKALARFKLDKGASFAKDHYIYCLSFFPYTHDEGLSLYEVALLANVKTLKSIRNATYAKCDPLRTYKEHNNVLVSVNEARRWLETRRNFVPSEIV